MRDNLIIATAIAGIIGLIVTVPVSCGVAIDYANCRSIGSNTSKPVHYSPMSGCYINVDNQWVPVEQWRVMK